MYVHVESARRPTTFRSSTQSVYVESIVATDAGSFDDPLYNMKRAWDLGTVGTKVGKKQQTRGNPSKQCKFMQKSTFRQWKEEMSDYS